MSRILNIKGVYPVYIPFKTKTSLISYPFDRYYINKQFKKIASGYSLNDKVLLLKAYIDEGIKQNK